MALEKKLSLRLLKKIKKEKKVKCPYRKCGGLIKEVNQEYHPYTQNYQETLYIYSCTKDPNHRWYFREGFLCGKPYFPLSKQ